MSGTMIRTALLISTFAGLSLAIGGCVESGAGSNRGKSNTSEQSGPAKLVVVGGDSVNWGAVAPSILKHTIKLTNGGGDTLRIGEIRPSCGCTTAPIDKTVLGPGDTATIEVALDAKERSGEQHKTLTINSNDSARPSMQVRLSANILRDVVVGDGHGAAMFPIVTTKAAGGTATSQVVIKNSGTSPLTIQPPTLATPAKMIVEFDMKEPRQIASGDSLQIVAHVKTISTAPEVANVVIRTSSKLVPEVRLNLTAQVDPNK